MPPRRPAGGDVPAHAGSGDLLVQLADELVEVERVLSGRLGLVAGLLGVGAHRDPPLLVIDSRVGSQVGFVLELPPLPALHGPQGPGAFGAGRAGMGQGVPAGDEHLVHLAGVEVGAAELDRTDAGSVLDGQVFDHLAGQRRRHPLSARASL